MMLPKNITNCTVQCTHCPVDMVEFSQFSDKSLSEVFSRTQNCIKKGSRIIIIAGNFLSTALLNCNN